MNNKQKISLFDLPALVAKYQWLIGLTFVLSVGVAVSVLARQIPVYRSSTTLERQVVQDNVSVQQLDIEINNRLRILITPEIVSKAGAGISRPIEEVRTKVASISATRPKDTSLIQLTVDALDPVVSADFANSWATVFLTSLQTGEKDKYRIIEKASPAPAPFSPRIQLTFFVASFIGLGTGIVLAFLLELQRRKKQSGEPSP